MAGFLSRMFPRLFPDPAQLAMERKMRITGAIRRFEREVKNQERFIKDYLEQAIANQRTGDMAGYAQVKKMIAFSFAYRRRAQKGLNTLRLFSTMADQMEAYRDFCGAISDISKTMGEAFSFADVAKIQQQLQESMGKAESMQQMMDQLLDGFDQALEAKMPEDLDKLGVKGDDIDALVAQMAKDRDSLTEDRIAQALNNLESQK